MKKIVSAVCLILASSFVHAGNEPSEPGVAMPAQGVLLTTGATIVNGDVYVWGFRGSSQQGNGQMVVSSKDRPAKVQSLKNIKALTGGAYHLVALEDNGDVYGWGQSGYGETGCPGFYVSTPCKVMNNVVQIAAGEYFTIALSANGQVYTWGHNLYGQLGGNGTKNSSVPYPVNLNGEKVRLIGGAYEGAFAVTEEGHVWVWGDNEGAGLGLPCSTRDCPTAAVQSIVRTPTRALALEPYAKQMNYIAGGQAWGEALLNDGRVIGWGRHGSVGQVISRLKYGSTAYGNGVFYLPNYSQTPVLVMEGVAQLYARYQGSVALTNDGKIYTWGWGEEGYTAFPMIYSGDLKYTGAPALRNNVKGKVISIGGGKEHIFYWTDDGKMYGVGYNDLYKLNQSTCCTVNGKWIDWPGSEIFLD